MLFKICKTKKSDIRDIFNLFNDDLIRNNSFNNAKISWKEHSVWFNAKIEDPNTIYFVVRDMSNNFIGQVRFDPVEGESKAYSISIGLHERYRGRGLGKNILKEVTHKVFNNFDVEKIFAYIKGNNKGSIKCFCDVGYKVVRREIIKGFDSFKLCYEN